MNLAIQLFEEKKYKESFERFAEIYNQTSQEQVKKDIMQELRYAFLSPNKDSLINTYNHNVSLLKKYPYIWGNKFEEYDQLRFIVFPVDDETFYIYDRTSDKFSEEYDVFTDEKITYFFEDLKQPLQLLNELNFYNLVFLLDNVRSSEDLATDNHIYLLYDSAEKMEFLMQVSPFDQLLKSKKFVFLVGSAYFNKYPINFKEEFGIDYISMTPRHLRIDEMNRICYWWKRGYSGSSFVLNVLGENPYVAMKEFANLLYYTKVDSVPLFQSSYLRSILSNIEKSYDKLSFRALFENPSVELCWPDYHEFLEWLDQRYENNIKLNLSEYLRAYFIFTYEQRHPNFNPRIVPVILWEPHLNEQTLFLPLVMTFTYRRIMNCIREPIQTAGRIFQREGYIFIYSDYILSATMDEQLRKDYYVVKFEDLKLYPKETSVALCQTLNIPYDSKMLSSRYSENVSILNHQTGIYEKTNECVTGFDLAPLYRKVDDVFSDFDQVRLKIFYSLILDHYGYDSFSFDECPMSDQDVLFLLKFPFSFESKYVKSNVENITASELRKVLFKTMSQLWLMFKHGTIELPHFIQPKLDVENTFN